MYHLSTDYDELFRLICAGHIAVGFVDYRFSDEDEVPMRDVVQIRRHREYDISIGARGIAYGSVHTFQSEDGPEAEVFASHCRACKLSYVPACGSKAEPIILSPEDQVVLAEALINPSEPNDALKRAIERRTDLSPRPK